MPSNILIILFLLNTLFSIKIILSHRKRPGTSWAWLMLLFFMPFFGFFIYLLFGLEGRTHKNFIKKYSSDKKILAMLHTDEDFKILRDASDLQSNLAAFNLRVADSNVTNDNDVKFYHEGNDKFDDLIQDMNSAKEFIHVQYYILKNDQLGRRIINILAKKAEEGVEVRLLIDKLGSRLVSAKILRPLISAKGQVVTFQAPHIMKLNYRNHRKICIIDGHTGYIGGFNIGNEYLGKVKRFGYWRDCHMRIHGSATKDLEARFAMDWNYSSKKDKIEISPFYFPDHASNQTISIKRGTTLQIVGSGPDTKHFCIQYAYLKMIAGAKKNIYIQTPYFIPDDSILDMLVVAVHSGIDVKIMIPSRPDHPFVYHAALSYLGELIDAGAKCYGYKKGFVHSKLVLIDGEVASVGTANMDIRSLKLNFEINAFLYDKKSVEFLENKFMVDISHSQLMDSDWYHSLPRCTKIKESLCRLVSPLL